MSFYIEGTWACCGEKGHISLHCLDKDKTPENKWRHRIATQHLEANEKQKTKVKFLTSNQ